MSRGYMQLYLPLTQADRVVKALLQTGTKADEKIAARIERDIADTEARHAAFEAQRQTQGANK